jgi:hypothetical protein
MDAGHGYRKRKLDRRFSRADTRRRGRIGLAGGRHALPETVDRFAGLMQANMHHLGSRVERSEYEPLRNGARRDRTQMECLRPKEFVDAPVGPPGSYQLGRYQGEQRQKKDPGYQTKSG